MMQHPWSAFRLVLLLLVGGAAIPGGARNTPKDLSVKAYEERKAELTRKYEREVKTKREFVQTKEMIEKIKEPLQLRERVKVLLVKPSLRQLEGRLERVTDRHVWISGTK